MKYLIISFRCTLVLSEHFLTEIWIAVADMIDWICIDVARGEYGSIGRTHR